MTIQIIHSRHPDYECAFRVFVDGVETKDFSVTDIDPGRGYSRADWDETTDYQVENAPSPAYAEAVKSWRDTAGESQFIRDED